MKTVLFISSNKVLGQGLSAAIHAKPELDFLWAAQFHYPQAVVGVDIFHADVVMLDIVDQADMDQAVGISSVKSKRANSLAAMETARKRDCSRCIFKYLLSRKCIL